MNKKFEGVFPALITPMDSDGNLNESAMRKVIEFNICNPKIQVFFTGPGFESM